MPLSHCDAANAAVPCMVCGRPTLGSFGPPPACNYWARLCQTCKDAADAATEREAIAIGKVMKEIAP